MTPTEQTLALARKYYQAGDLQRAESHYRQILQENPEQAEVWCSLAIACQGLGKIQEAVAGFQQALRLRPDFAEAHNNLGIALAMSGQPDLAVQSFERALSFKADLPGVYNNLGNVLQQQGKLDAAVAAYRQALRVRPNDASAHNNLANVLRQQGKLDEAVHHYHQSLSFKPQYPEAHNNLGNVLRDQGKLDDAVASYREALRLRPAYAEAHDNLGNVYRDQGKLEEAIASYRQALRLTPNDADVHNHLGLALREQNKPAEAEQAFRRALQLKPQLGEVHANLGNALRDQGQLDETLKCYEQALALKPDYPAVRLNRALTWLQMGKFEEGWPEYEYRWQIRDAPKRVFAQPRWDGSPLGGRTILLHAEQGLGDTLNFIRYAALVKERGGTVVVESQKPLLRLLAGCAGIDSLIAQGDPLPDFKVESPLLSLPGIFKTTLDTIPAKVPYIAADTALVEHWREELGRWNAFKIGIVWQGNPGYRGDAQRSFPLAQFGPVARLEGVHLFSLQKSPGLEQLSAVTGHWPITDWGSRLDGSGPFLDTAAIMKCLDLVIAPETAAAHLAGALGVPVWVPLAFMPDWRMPLNREDSPWYPTMRLFRQREPGTWQEVFERITRELQRLLAAAAKPPAITVEIAPGELIDKITILEIKNERLTDPDKRQNVRLELATLTAARDLALAGTDDLRRLSADLKAVNEKIWEVEDAIRDCERQGNFGPRFVQLARSVYHNNDHRAALKRQINELLGSRLVEEKSYAAY